MSSTPWMTTSQLIAAVKRKIAMPISQITFTEEDLIAFLNEEMMISMVPSVMSFHEEYFVHQDTVPLESDKNRYPIPDRAIGQKLRDLFWSDDQDNYFEMSRISSEDKAFFQRNTGSNQAIHKYYLEGNDIVLTQQGLSDPTGKLSFFYFLRPNQLVADDQAAIINKFVRYLDIDNTNLVAGNTVSINGVVFTAVAGAPSTNEFQIGGTSIISATNLTTAINTNGIVVASNGSPSTAIISLKYTNLKLATFSSDTTGMIFQDNQGIEFDSIPSTITNGSIVDILQTKSGHRTYAMDIEISSTGVSGSIIIFGSSEIPEDVQINDYVCLANECIIPQIPSDLHIALVEKACARVLSALGDTAGLQAATERIKEVEYRQGTLIDSRVDGSPQKITGRHSLLRFGKSGSRRRL